MAPGAGVIDDLAAERSPAVMTPAAALIARPSMLSERRQRHLNSRFAQHLMTFRATDPFAPGVDLMRESIIISTAHYGRPLLTPRSRMALAATRPAHRLARLHLLRRFMTNVTFAVRGESGPRSRERVAVRAIGALASALVSRMSLVRKLRPERLSFGELDHSRLDRLDPFVAIGADAETGRGEFFNVTGDASAVARHHRLDGVGPSHVALVALDLAVL